MTDLAFGVQSAIFDALSAAVTLATVTEQIEEDAATPLVALGEDLIEDLSGKDADQFERHTVTIATIVDEQGKKTLREIQEQVRSALHGKPITADGCALSSPRFLTNEDMMSEDGTTYIGHQKFVILAQPDD